MIQEESAKTWKLCAKMSIAFYSEQTQIRIFPSVPLQEGRHTTVTSQCITASKRVVGKASHHKGVGKERQS
ncbi:rCG48541 [Rattus norvegicus]|uniref:RCG48541 n=1 Tax=Rattus norvegicus TaxID=10116 RepID=A6HXA2_RAT|nr:rCG48541 [Rattus norvegicus]